ncbi:uncharacterized protein LOC9632184 isoform X1 [Selaginella moellendorffii]|uniref:uncharacterized protein LOC9632184 isoform X1 n=1 Tax=Selaginella moellendorffii TaxID=88036 RepID=UPI000D1D0E16|nr:uncharacterized protein LOC9632184 isoform X1 [Selaginella moellendorffii]|eukprot:XP_024531164.1 uncharacterized protein LOC9632184 isoform X1 [Selaginella moellendorffii]
MQQGGRYDSRRLREMELQSGRAAALASRMSAAGGGFSSMRLVLGHRDFALLGQCGVSIGRGRKRIDRKYGCDGVAGISSALSMDWRPAFDEVLLMSSVLLAYVAGVVRPFAGLTGKKALELPVSTGSIAENDQQKQIRVSNSDFVWDTMSRKLVEAISTVEAGAMDVSSTPLTSNPSLCLQALAYGPRLRLLLAALSLLRNEASSREISLEDVCSMVGPVCRLWISQELRKTEKTSAGYFSGSMIKTEDLSGDVETEAKEYMSTRLQRSGKANLYADFLYHQCKKSFSSRTFSDQAVSTNLANNVLEDIVIAISDGAAAMYLGAVSGVITGWPTLLLPSICSTRSLERFRNEVALYQWIHYNFDSVAAIYEDRVELWGLTANAGKNEPAANKAQKKQKRKPLEGVDELYFDRLSVRVRRSKELKALSGWRYYYSLYMEFSDVVGPLLRILVTKLGQGLSFLLVCLIGRSFGLIYQGIRQSVKWSSD